LYSFETGRPVNIIKKPLSGGGRGESEITNRSLNARFKKAKYNHLPVESSRKINFFSGLFDPFSRYHCLREELRGEISI
jgi:hypothetical protein